MNETNAGGVRRRSVETVVPVHDEAHVLADGVRRGRRRLHGRRPALRPGGVPATGRPAPVRPQRPRERQSAAPAGGRGQGPPARVRLPFPHLLLEAGLGARCSDAQCGFEAARTDVFRPLRPCHRIPAVPAVPAVPRRTCTPQVPAARPLPTVLPAGANTYLEYAS